MKRFSLVFALCLLWTGSALAHTDIAGLPDSVAIMSYRQILYLNPDDLTTRNSLAMALCRTNKLEEATTELQFVLKKDSRNFNALDGLGVVLMKIGKHEEALKYFEEAVEINPRDLMVHVHLSAAYHMMNQAESAKNEWKTAESLVSDVAMKKQMKDEFRWVTGR